jgi:hypothetical protein
MAVPDSTVTTVTSKEAAKFIEDINHRFGVPNRVGLLGFLPGQPHRRLLLLGGPPTVQWPGRASKWHGASSRQRPHLRRRFAVRDQVACRAAPRHLRSPNQGQLGHGILAIILGVRIGGGPPN